MYRVPAIALVLCIAMAMPVVAQEADVSKAINLGPLADSFTLVSAEAGPHERGIGIWLKLRAKKDVDTTDLYYQVGFFDKGKVVIKRLTSATLMQEPKVSVRTLTQPEADCLLLTVRIELGVSDAEKKKLLEQVRAKAQRLAGSEYAQIMLGEAEARYGDRALAQTLFQAAFPSAQCHVAPDADKNVDVIWHQNINRTR